MRDGKLVVAQIGCGAFAEGQDFPNFKSNPHVQLKWCCDISEPRAAAMAAKFNVERATADMDAVFADPELDLVKIATSHEAHLPIVERAAARGVHIFCEKPMAMEEDEAFKIIAAVRRGKVKLCVDFNRRMAPSLLALRERWRAQRQAPSHQPWRYAETDREPFPEERQTQFLVRVQDESNSYRLVHLDPRRGGGQIIGESCHWLDLARWLFAPQYPVEVQAWGSTRFSHGVNLRFSGGDTATILFHCSGTFDYPKELYEICSDASLLRNHYFVENEYRGVPGLSKELFPLQSDGFPQAGAQGGLAGYLEKLQALQAAAGDNSKKLFGSLAVDKGHKNMLDALRRRHSPGQALPLRRDGWLHGHLPRQAGHQVHRENRQPYPVLLEKVFPCVV